MEGSQPTTAMDLMRARRQTQFAGARFAHDQHARRAVGQRRGAGGGNGAVDGIKRRPQRCQPFCRSIRADHFIKIITFEDTVSIVTAGGDNLAGECARLRGGPGALMGARGKCILHFTADLVHARQHFCGQAHHAGSFRHGFTQPGENPRRGSLAHGPYVRRRQSGRPVHRPP